MRAQPLAATLLLGLSVASGAFGQPAPVAPPAAPAAQSSPSAPPPANTGAAPTPPSAPGPAASAAPDAPPGYYVEQGPREAAPPVAPNAVAPNGPAEPPPPAIYEPPPPGPALYEPPPPPIPRHVSPRTSLWLGARLGWFIPFGSAYARGALDPLGNVILTGVPWKDYVSSGPDFELDAGMRLGRYYQVFALWQRAELSSGGTEKHLYGGQHGGDSDFFALSLRATTDADRVGLVTEVAVGYRQARASWADGSELRMTGGVLEGRLGLGADIRLSPVFTLSPLIELGVGSFDRVRRVVPGGGSYDLIGPDDAPGSHGWFTFGVGGYADLLGVR